MTHTPSFEEKVDQFSQFIALLSGQLGVSVSFGEKKDGGGIVLPDISGFDEKRLDFLYALCLREAGVLAKSRRRMTSYLDFKTQNDVLAAMMIESGRIERYLVRKFGGAAEILERHWGQEAHDPELGTMAFGFDPTHATPEQTFFAAVKWSMLGRPRRFKWELLFPADLWATSTALLDEQYIAHLLSKTILRSWEDARTLGVKLLESYYAHTHTQDESLPLARPAGLEKWEEVHQALTKSLPEELKPLLEKKAALKEEVKELQEKLENKLKAKGLDIKQMRKDLAQVKSAANALKSVARPLAKLDKTQNRATSMAEKLEVKKQISQTKAEKRLQQQEALEGRAQQLEDKAEAVKEAAREKEINELNKIHQKKTELEEKIKALEDQTQDSEMSESKKQALEEKKSSLQSRVDALEEKIKDIHQKREKTEERADRFQEKAQTLQSRQQEALERAQGEAAASMSKEESLRSEISELEQKAKQLQNQLEKEALDKGLNPKNLDSEKMNQQVQSLSAQQNSMSDQLKDALGDRSEIQDLNNQIRELENEARIQAHEVLSKIQSEMDAAGIPCEMVERFDEMEGWDGANKAQREFDERATQTLHQPVINGSGGGRGRRDLLTEIAEHAKGIAAIDPNEIFAEVARLSPLSGFSESGSREGEGGVANLLSGPTVGAVSKSRHTVWSREFDKIETAKVRDGKTVAKMRQELFSPIKKTREVFLRKMKPSFKLRFRGGREEGDLDPRAIWKLAARQGEDFYETTFRRADKKSSAIILVDLSGSVASWGEYANERLQGLTLLLSEGLDAAQIDHEVLGYCAPVDERLVAQTPPVSFNRKSCRLDTLVVRSFRDKDMSALPSLQIQPSDNSDGESLRLAVDRLRRRPGKTRIIFMICDGKPFMHDADSEILDEDLRSALQYAARQKVVVLGLGFSENHPVFGEQYMSLKEIGDLSREIEKRL